MEGESRMIKYTRMVVILSSLLIIMLIFSASPYQRNEIRFEANSCKTLNTKNLCGEIFSTSTFSDYTGMAKLYIFNNFVYNSTSQKGANIIESIKICGLKGDTASGLVKFYNFTITNKEFYGKNIKLGIGRYKIDAVTIFDYYNKSDFLNSTLSGKENTIIMNQEGFSVLNYFEILDGLVIIGLLSLIFKKSKNRIPI